jgi:DNA-binding Lrp family transcriptional regulator
MPGAMGEPHTPCFRVESTIKNMVKNDKYRQGANMVTSIILINAERTKINKVAEQLAEIEGISEAYSVSGKYDIVAIARVPSNEALAQLVTNKLLGMDAILKTETMLAFQAYSRHDLDAMFAVGM